MKLLRVAEVTGFTAYMRLLDIGGGSSRWRGKMSYATEVLRFDVCLDYHADDFAEQLAKACPKGIDIYSCKKTLLCCASNTAAK